MSFSHIIETVFAGSHKTIIQLNNFESAFIKRIINEHPTSFNSVFADDKITIADIPNLVLIVSQLYLQHVANNDINIDIINIIEFTLNVYIETLTILPPEKLVLHQIVTSCLELLKTNLPFMIQQEQKCVSWSQYLWNKLSYCCKCSCTHKI